MPFVPRMVSKRQLLSFAQFEREVTGERIRDKKKAMAMKGMWGSGVTPFGYDRTEKKLVPNKEQSGQVREMFRLYIELGSVNLLRKRLRDRGIRSQNGRDWTDGNLYNILRRKLYIGKIEHKSRMFAVPHRTGNLSCNGVAQWNVAPKGMCMGAAHCEVYDGQHEAIVDKEVFRKAQQILDTNKRRSTSKVSHAPCHPWQAWHTQHPVARGKHNSLLAGKIFDSEG